MKFLQIFKGNKHKYFIFIFIGVGISIVYFVMMINWMEIVRCLLGNPSLSFDQQPFFLQILNKICAYLLWIILGILFIQGLIRKNLVVAIFVGLGFLLSYIGLLTYMIGGPVVNDYANRIHFDSSKWQDEKLVNSRNPVRIRMVDDLLKKHDLVGMTRDDLIALLGVPPKTDHLSHYFVYWLGPERGFISIDTECLVIKFENDKVIEAKVTRD